ncbi:MAG: hypothetical protein R6V10_15360, partial [bacterium]
YQVLAVPAMAWVLVSATLLVPLADVAHEHRAYPLVAVVCGALFAGVLPEIYKIHRWKKPVIVASAAIILFFALQTFSRNQDWENELHLLSDSMRKSPQKPRVIYNYADELKWYGEFDKALFWYKRHHEMEPDRQDTRVMIEMLEKRLGE